MPRLIFKCHHLRPGAKRSAAHRGNYVKYVATRDGVERLPPKEARLPATQKQNDMVQQLLRKFPLSRGTLEYEDYQVSPTRAAASAFISRAIEDNLDQIVKRENYLDYIANRPRVQKVGDHGLFTQSGKPVVLSQAADTVAHHPGRVWLPIISLRREDAERLGYDCAANWQALLSALSLEIAEIMRIPSDQFRWYAAFHDENSHPHVHMVCYSADGKSGFLTEKGMEQIKSRLAKEIFRQELTELYQKQTMQRDSLAHQAGETMRSLISQMENGTLQNQRIQQLLEFLAQQLLHNKGKKQYGYLKAELKSGVNEIVDELAKDARVAQAYDLWYELREEVLRTFRNDLPDRLPLSQQNEFKRIKNLIIEEAARLGEQPTQGPAEGYDGDITSQPAEPVTQTIQPPPMQPRRDIPKGDLLQSVNRLLHHAGHIFQQQAQLPVTGIHFTDRKLRQKIREKKIAMGHKADDHENQQTM